MAYEPQPVYLREMLLTPKKKTTYAGGPLADAEFTYRARFDGDTLYAMASEEFRSDVEHAGKGHPWPTERQAIARDLVIGGAVEVDAFLAGWLTTLMLKKSTRTGVGPYTWTSIFEQTTRIAPVTDAFFKHTNDIYLKAEDLVMQRLRLSGSERGPLVAEFQLQGSGKWTDNDPVTPPALPTRTMLLGSDTAILLGAPGAAGAVDVGRRSTWEIEFTDGSYHRRAPGGGLVGVQANIGLQRVTGRVTFRAKDTDDLYTLMKAGTLQELQINTNSGANAQLNIKILNVKFPLRPPASDNGEVVWSLEFGEMDVLKPAGNLVEVVAINDEANHLVAA
jgi:hypothetical protein